MSANTRRPRLALAKSFGGDQGDDSGWRKLDAAPASWVERACIHCIGRLNDLSSQNPRSCSEMVHISRTTGLENSKSQHTSRDHDE